MREFLKTKGFKMTPQRELIFRAFFEMDKHVSVDELFGRVREKDTTIGYATVWRNLKLICKVGLAEEVNLGDGITRYDRVTDAPHGHLFCLGCKSLIEFEADKILDFLTLTASKHDFTTENVRVEIQGYCAACRASQALAKSEKPTGLTASKNPDKSGETVV